MSTLVEIMLAPQGPGEEPRLLERVYMDSVPLPGENISVSPRVFQVRARAWAVVRVPGPTHVECGLVVTQIDGPPMLVATPSALIMPG